ncbi:uncharacterized protein LOC121589934 [Anopheles merus]|uniref:uncharacterized protein LOC121589934 n=1 Tax=Anopheles merus TaxID=30066 RepID=UPI001BE42AB1|nr:uncharacterized protein LOC121589934 [Anopheles merus]
MCKKNGHSIASCNVFKGTNTQERMRVVSEKRLCRNCLKAGHLAHACASKYNCQQCSQRHHTLLHAHEENSSVLVGETSSSSTMALASSKKSAVNAILSTVVLVVVDAYGKEHLARALLDNGSQPNAISEHLCQLLRLPRKPASVSIAGVDSTTTNAKHIVCTEVRSRIYHYRQAMNFLVLKKVTQNIPSTSFSTAAVGVPSNYVLADPDFGTARRVDMIIGAAYFYSLLRGGQVHLPNQRNVLIDTVFGWLVAGDTPTFHESQSQTTISCHMMEATDKLQEQLERFWKVEELAITSLSPVEQQCEQYFKQTTNRDDTGRYVVRMPKHHDYAQMLGDSKAAAQKRFRLLEQRLAKDKHLKQQYDDFMREYVTLGYMFPVPVEEDSMAAVHYLPHHPVVKESSTTTKETEVVQTFELATVTYGLAPSSFLATRTLLQLAEDEGAPYPLATEAVKKNLYVDDLISGAESIEQAIQLRDELTSLMSKGGFRFRKWCSNELSVLDGLTPDLLGTTTSHEFEAAANVKTLGICWEPPNDVFRFTIAIPDVRPCTKRTVLSTIAQLYDPLGLLSPIIVQAKILLQELWANKLGWDDELPRQLCDKWEEFCEQLPMLAHFKIPRFALTPNYNYVELHCFADASEAAYGACAYLRSQSIDGTTQVTLLASKSRVAPLKPLTIPRLELCAALLAARLQQKLISAIDMAVNETHMWSDSTITLQWLAAPPRTWKTFIANRVGEIQAATNGCIWHHVPGIENPADMLSRGVSAELLLESNMWMHGPDWLMNDSSCRPSKSYGQQHFTDDELERKGNVVLTAQVVEPDPLLLRYSSFRTLVHVTAYCMRFCHIARGKEQRETINLSVDEIQNAKIVLVKMVQRQVFPDELRQLRKKQKLAGGSPLKLLHPFIDKDGVIRVGGRLGHADLPFCVKHPIVIPGYHPFTQLLLRQQHEKVMHGGITSTLSAIRGEFWPLNGRRAVRSTIRACYRCNRANPVPIQQPMGQLPLSRVTANEVFVCTGVDYCGPIMLKPVHRKAAPQKAYLCIFVCMSTKAVHLELVSDLSTSGFLKALDRFIFRRNKPNHIYSDNGTNFVGAKNALHQVYQMLHDEAQNRQINNYLAEEGIEWHLIPPRAPNFGGLWEAAVKVAKKLLVRQLGVSLLSYEDLATVLIKIEGCMNSRPLTPLSNDPNDLSALTPSHFLIKGMMRPPPETDIRDVPTNRLDQYQRLQKYAQHFWQRWRTEYLHELAQQQRRNPPEQQVSIGDIVIIKDEHLPSARWPLARIVEVHPGQDGIVRVVTLKTASGVMKRPSSKICLLECSREF